MVGTATTIAADHPYSATHGSLEEEMTQRFAHTQTLYKEDNATLYAQIMIATLGSHYTSTIAPLKISKNNRS